VTVTSEAATSTSSDINHVWIIIFENQPYPFTSSAPYLTSLAENYSLAGNYSAIMHPSLPNYLAIIGGSTFGVTDDNIPPSNVQPASTKTLVSLIQAKGLTWKAYMESMPSPCDNADAYPYAVKHDPFVYFKSITANTSYAASHVVDFTQLQNDISSNTLPSFVWITPNMLNDMHDTTLTYGDNWLKGFLTPILSNQTIMKGTVIFVTFDEGNAASNYVYLAAIGNPSLVKSGFTSHNPYNHYSLLATVESIFGLGNLGRNDATASPMSDLFTSSVPSPTASPSSTPTSTPSPTPTPSPTVPEIMPLSLLIVLIVASSVAVLHKKKSKPKKYDT
jgi:acid phosphatase